MSAPVKVLIANRGEIAVRVIRACRELGFRTVAVYSEPDRNALHARMADEAYALGGATAADSYLRIEALLDVARRSGATLVHPGYGFLAENEDFAQACLDAGLTFIGPSPEVIALMGSKTAARQAAIRAGVPVVPGTEAPFADTATDAEITAEAARIGYPLVVKAVAGGGGKGMRTVDTPDGLLPAIRTARSEAGSAFGDSAVYLERRIVKPRHIEIQLLGDHHGTVIPFVERECSIQRRHQKVVEESPSMALTPAMRRTMAECAAMVARSVGYTNAGTIEFLYEDSPDGTGRFYFLEMNTRLQVEHPVTEQVTGIDLVHWQLRIARGERLTIDPERALTPRAHAIECRIYAEDPDRGFMPSPGLVRAISAPSGPGVRDDRGVAAGFAIPIYYDSMIAKLVCWGDTRDEAIRRARRALDEYRVVGIKTTTPFFQWLLQQDDFRTSRFDTTYLDALLTARKGERFAVPDAEAERAATVAVALGAWMKAHKAAAGAGPATGGGHATGAGGWRQTARREGLRG